MKGGTGAYKQFNDQRNDWVEKELKRQGLVDPVSTTRLGSEGDSETTTTFTKEQQAALDKVPGGAGWESGGDSGGFTQNPEYEKLRKKFEKEQWKKSQAFKVANDKLRVQWLDTLPPEQKAKALKEFSLHSSDMGAINKYGSMATLSLLGTIAGGAGAAAFSGAAGSAAGGASSLAPTSTGSGLLNTAGQGAIKGAVSAGVKGLATGNLSLKDIATGAITGGVGAAGTNLASGLMNTGNVQYGGAGSQDFGDVNPGDQNFSVDNPEGLTNPGDSNGSWDVPGNVPTDGGNPVEIDPAGSWDVPGYTGEDAPFNPDLSTTDIGVGAVETGGGGDQDWISKAWDYVTSGDTGSLMKFLGNLKPSQWVSIVSGAGGLINALQDPKTVPIPDFKALAIQQAGLNAASQDKTTLANRPTQIDPEGNVLSWTKGKDGKWTQKVVFGPENAKSFKAKSAAELAALNKIRAQGEFKPAGLREFADVMNPKGNAKEIQSAWMNLMRPERKLARDREVQRLKSQGLSENSTAFQAALLRQDKADTDAQNKAIIAGHEEYGRQFGRSLQRAGEYRAQRGMGFDEYETGYNKPMETYKGLIAAGNPDTNFERYAQENYVAPPDVYRAAVDTYAAQVGQANAYNANQNNLTQGLLNTSAQTGGWGQPTPQPPR